MATNDTTRLLIATDLDGTLLDHASYAYAPALPVLQALRARGVPVVFNSSKTAAELTVLRRKLDNHDPYIAENGAVVHLPKALGPHAPVGTRLLGVSAGAVRAAVQAVRAQLGCRCTGFSELDADAVAALTGLDRAAAEQARTRDASEPLVWHDSEAMLAHFRTALHARGLTVVRGGRFVHVGGETDKGRALCWLAAAYRAQSSGGTLVVIAAGDADNDRPMLAAADVAVVVPRPDGSRLDVPEAPRRIVAPAPGPAGWAAAMRQAVAPWLDGV